MDYMFIHFSNFTFYTVLFVLVIVTDTDRENVDDDERDIVTVPDFVLGFDVAIGVPERE